MKLDIYQDTIEKQVSYETPNTDTSLVRIGNSMIQKQVNIDTNNLMMEYNTAKLDLDIKAKDRENRANLDGNIDGVSVVSQNLIDYKALKDKFSKKALWGPTRDAVAKFSANVDSKVRVSNSRYTSRLAGIKSSVNLSNMVTKTVENINRDNYRDNVMLLQTSIGNMVASPETKSKLMREGVIAYSKGALDHDIEVAIENKTPNQALQGLLSIKADIGMSDAYKGLDTRSRELLRNKIDREIINKQKEIQTVIKTNEKLTIASKKAGELVIKNNANDSIKWLKSNPAKTSIVKGALKGCQGSNTAYCKDLEQTVMVSDMVVDSLGKADYDISKFSPEGLVEFNTMRSKYKSTLNKSPLEFLNVNYSGFMQGLQNDLASGIINKSHYNQTVLDQQIELGVPAEKLRILTLDDDKNIKELYDSKDYIGTINYIELNGNTGESNGGVYYATDRLIDRNILPKGFNALNIGGEGVTLEDNGDIVKALTEYKSNKTLYDDKNKLTSDIVTDYKEIIEDITSSERFTNLSNTTLRSKELNEITMATRAYAYMLLNQGLEKDEATAIAIKKVVNTRFKAIPLSSNGWFDSSMSSILVDNNISSDDYESLVNGFDNIIDNLEEYVIAPESSVDGYYDDLRDKIGNGKVKFLQSPNGANYHLVPITGNLRSLNLTKPINLQLFKSLGL